MELKEWYFNTKWDEFRSGTIHGLIRLEKKSLKILAIENESIGNGQFSEFMDELEEACADKNLVIYFMEVWNDALRVHLVEKRGYEEIESTLHLAKR